MQGVPWFQAVKEASITNFGLLIAFLLPGFVALWGVSYVFEPVRAWFGASPDNAPTIGGFLYVTLASVAAGLTVSTIRWMTVDKIHHVTGVARPSWDFTRLQEHATAFDLLNESHYRFYQFYANMTVALFFADAMRHCFPATGQATVDALDGFVAVLIVVFFAGSRDTLSKYYDRGGQLLRNRSSSTVPRSKQR